MARLQISLRGVLVLMTVVAVLLAIGIEIDRRIENFVVNPYRLQYTGNLLLEYLENVDEWPRDWDALRQYVESHRSDRSHLYAEGTFQKLRDNITIDFAFNRDSVDLHSNGEIE